MKILLRSTGGLFVSRGVERKPNRKIVFQRSLIFVALNGWCTAVNLWKCNRMRLLLRRNSAMSVDATQCCSPALCNHALIAERLRKLFAFFFFLWTSCLFCLCVSCLVKWKLLLIHVVCEQGQNPIFEKPSSRFENPTFQGNWWKQVNLNNGCF